MKLIRYFSRTRYWQIYAFNHPPEGYYSRRAINIPFQKLGMNSAFFTHSKFVLPFERCDLYHTYNSVVTGSTPWVVEVETTVPRYGDRLQEGDKRFDWGINKLKSDACGAIIFTSEYTQGLNRENFERWGIDWDKCHQVYRAIETYQKLPREGQEKQFTISFVGNGFYRKGGVELLKAFKEFKKDGTRLVIISTFETDWAVTPSEEDVQFVKDEIENNGQIEVHQNLSHAEVIRWMRKSDVFVNTTYADTFNNAILEALSCGVPVIVTDVRAIPEFVEDGYNGFMMTPDYNHREEMIAHILQNLKKYYSDSGLLKRHSENALEMVQSKFLIGHRNKKLAKIYGDILN